MASLADWYNMAAWIDQAEKERCCPLDPWLNHCPGAWNTMRLVVPSLDEEEIESRAVLFFFFKCYLFIWLHQVLAATYEIFDGTYELNCPMAHEILVP